METLDSAEEPKKLKILAEKKCSLIWRLKHVFLLDDRFRCLKFSSFLEVEGFSTVSLGFVWLVRLTAG